MNEVAPPTRRYRSIWISDIHLGTRGCKAELLLDFLRHTESEYLYLVGDIIDCWRLRRAWFWAQSHNDVVQKVLRKARKGTRVIYVPGNHDEPLRDYTDMQFGGITVLGEAIHEMADGRRLLILHGDAFDGIVKYAKWLALLGDQAYNLMIVVNSWFNQARRRLGYPYWSLSAYLKLKVKNAVSYIGEYERTLIGEAQRHAVEGVICGHIHHAIIREDFGIRYINCGDWVESCTAIAENIDGRFEIITWSSISKAPHVDVPALEAERQAAA